MTTITKPDEVSLDDTLYRLSGGGQIRPVLAADMPEKIVIGDYKASSNPRVSSIVVNDQRLGIGILDADEPAEIKRCWFSTAEIAYKNAISLPRLATSITLPTAPTAPTITNADMETAASGWTNGTGSGTRSSAEAHGGTYSWIVSTAQTDGTYTIIQDLAWDADYQNLSFTFTCWAKVNVQAGSGVTARISLDDGVSTTNGTTVGETATWTQLTVTKTLANTATRLRLTLEVIVADWNSGNPIAYFDDAALTTGALTLGNPTKFANFNGNTYVGFGTVLAKINTSTGASADFVHQMPQTITALLATVNSTLLIYQGDANNYLYMNTSEAFTTTNSANASLGVTWDDKAWKFDQTTNIIYHAATPNSATPTWTANGTLDAVPFGDVQNLIVDGDDSGNPIIKAATKQGIYEHDTTNAKWIEPAVQIPTHPNGGKGFATWLGKLYYSAGLDIWRYQASATTSVPEMVGPSKDNGLPAEYNGEITALIPGFNYLYALVDSTQSSGTTTSSILGFHGAGWHVIWEGTGTETAVTNGIVSSAYEYRLWFNNGAALIYITIERQWLNPNILSTRANALSAFHVTPNYYGDWLNDSKNQIALKIDSRGCSSTETIITKYRLNAFNEALTAGWTTCGTITTNTLTTYTFPAGSAAIGSLHRTIQFRYDLARAAGTTTLSPVIRYFISEFEGMITPVMAYEFIVDCFAPNQGNTPTQLRDNLFATAVKKTLVPLTYETTTYYVRVLSVTGESTTGSKPTGQYRVRVRPAQ